MYRIKTLRIEKGKSMAQVARELNLPYTTYVNYEKEEREPNSELLIQLANYFDCSTDYLIGRSDNRTGTIKGVNIMTIDNIIPLPKFKEIPLVGEIACGEPILAEENISEYIKAPDNTEATFALTCKGDSMINARIMDGDIVYIKQQSQVVNGEIAAVLIDCEATLKRVYYYPEKNMLILKPENSAYEDLIFVNEELNNIHIIGKAVAFTSNIR